MTQVVLSVRVDADVKKNFEEFCTNAGLNPSVAVNMFIRAALREKRIPFEIAADYAPISKGANKKLPLGIMENN